MWGSDDIYCEREYNKYKKATQLIDTYKKSEDENLRFFASYLEEILNENDNLEEQNDNYFKDNNTLKYERDQYKVFSKELQRIVLKERPGYVEYLRTRAKINEIEGE